MLKGLNESALVFVLQILSDFCKGLAMLLGVPVRILNNLDDPFYLIIFQAIHLLELPIIEEESLEISMLHVFDLALTVQSSFFEVSIINFTAL